MVNKLERHADQGLGFEYMPGFRALMFKQQGKGSQFLKVNSHVQVVVNGLGLLIA